MRAWLWLVLLCGGCAYRVSLTSTPSPAEVQLPKNRGTVVTPAEVRFRYVPFGSQHVVVSAPGYRAVEVDLRDHEIKLLRYVTDTLFRPGTLFGAPRGEVRFVLVPVHGPAGSWEADDVP